MNNPLGKSMLKYISRRFLTKPLLFRIGLFGLMGGLLIGTFSETSTARFLSQQTTLANTKTTIQHFRTAPELERLSGSNAINTSVAVSKKYYSSNTEVAYVVNRAAFADGVVAGSMKTNGPILYVNTASLPSAVAAELTRLKPQKVIIIGGASVVDNAVMTKVKQSTPSSVVERLSGTSRYDTAVKVSKADYPTGSRTVYVTNGTAYADAIIATQQASAAPLLYVSGSSAPSATIKEINRLKANQVIVVGSTGVVSKSIADSIAKQTGAHIKRIGGADRYKTAVSLSKELFPTGSDQVYISNGTAYADSILIGSIPTKGAMLYVSDRITDGTMTELQRLNAKRTTILGGDVRVSEDTGKQIKQIMHGAALKKRVKPGISYFVLAHPDDELASWAITDSSDYPVFILATQGEASYYCQKNGGKGSQQCRDRRISSWHKYLDNYYQVTDHGMQPGGFRLHKGADSARLIFDLGDGNLTASEVTQAINQARQVDYGLTQENYIASGNYWDDQRNPNCDPNRTDYACGLYDHRDHRAVYDSIVSYQHPNKITFHGSYNPRTNAGAVMDKTLFESMIACPNGTYNQAYSWLNPPCWTRENSRWDHWQWMREY